MVCLSEICLHFFLFLSSVAALAPGRVIKPVKVADLNALVQEQIKKPQNRLTLEAQTCEPNCPYGWVKFDGRCFGYFSQAVDWTTAEAHCLNLGANLVSLHSENEHQTVKALIRAYDPTEKPSWLGLSGCQKIYNWIWSDGSRFGYSKWNSHEPNNYNNNECCVSMNWSAEKNWNDAPCRNLYPFVCVKRL